MGFALLFPFLGVAGSGTGGGGGGPVSGDAGPSSLYWFLPTWREAGDPLPPTPSEVASLYWFLPTWRTALGIPGWGDPEPAQVASLYWFLPTWRTVAGVIVTGDWILQNGTWDDSGFWDDGANWVD